MLQTLEEENERSVQLRCEVERTQSRNVYAYLERYGAVRAIHMENM